MPAFLVEMAWEPGAHGRMEPGEGLRGGRAGDAPAGERAPSSTPARATARARLTEEARRPAPHAMASNNPRHNAQSGQRHNPQRGGQGVRTGQGIHYQPSGGDDAFYADGSGFDGGRAAGTPGNPRTRAGADGRRTSAQTVRMNAGGGAGGAGQPGRTIAMPPAGGRGGRRAAAQQPAAGMVPPGAAAKRRGKHKKLKVVLGVILALALVGGGAFAFWIGALDRALGFSTEAERQALLDKLAPTSGDDAYYVAILGSDARKGDTTSRSDVTMLARIDAKNKVVDLISIPRDTMVTIEGHGTQKINAAFAFGGAPGAVECISEFAGVPISHYVEVHFDELKDVVDLLGGITVTVPESFKAGNGGMSFSAGEQKLNGEQALAFARERYNVSGGDFGRAQAQRLIIMAIIQEVLDAPPTQLPGLIGELAGCVTTDYSVGDLVGLATKFQGSDLVMYQAACPSYSLSQGGVSYVGTMFDEWRAMMKRVDAGLDPTDTSATIPEPQASSTTLGAATNSAAPKDYRTLAANAGLTTDDVANAG